MIFRRLHLSLLASLALVSPGIAKVEENPEFQAAMQALADHLPAVAAEKLARIYRTPEGLSPEDLATVGSRFLESLVRQGRFLDALALCQEPTLERHPAMPFWKGISLARLGNHAEAEQQFRFYEGQVAEPYYIYATLTRANLLFLSGDAQGALTVLGPLLAPEIPEAVRQEAGLRLVEIHLEAGNLNSAAAILRELSDLSERGELESALLSARLTLAQGDSAKAERQFREAVQNSEGIHVRVHHRAQLGLADVQIQRENLDAATDQLVRFVSQSQDSPLLPEAFSRLKKLGFFTRERPHPLIATWLQSAKPELKGLTLFHAASQGKTNAEIQQLEAFLKQHADHFLANAATIRLAELYVDSAHPEKATDLLDQLNLQTLNEGIRQYVAYVIGRAEFALGNFAKSAESFRLAGGEEAENPNAVFNAAVAAIYYQNSERYLEEFQQLGLQESIAEAQADLQLERALLLAAKADREALTALQEFTATYPEHSRVAEAELALAEVYLLEFLPVAARKQMSELRLRELSNDLAERADYVSMWIEATAGNPDNQAVMLGREFLKAWPNSRFRSEVRMKLGEIYFAGKEFPYARDQFRLLAEEDPEGPLRDTALFFAGKAAELTMNSKSLENAIELWGRVVDRGGPLANEALRHQALATLKLGKSDDAIRVLNKLLEREKDLDPDLRLAVLLNKGQAATRKAADVSDSRSMLVSAIASFDRILDSPNASRFWKNQAAVHKARCLEQFPDDASALEVYYNVIRQEPTAGLSSEEVPEYTWYYRAGFSAIALLQKDEQWRAAIRLAERLAQTGGTRAIEAARLADTLRLEHFVWGDDE